MDLGFARLDLFADTAGPRRADLTVLTIRMSARQAASPTAREQARIDRAPAAASLFAPSDHAFNGETARALAAWAEDEEGVYRDD